MSHWLDQVESILAGQLPPREPVLLAISGGVDSMVLLYIVHELASKYEWRLRVAHFNHQLRAEASDADEELVRKTTAQLEVPLTVGRGDVQEAAKRQGISIEMAARQLRHDFLARTAREHRIAVVALAHHADDQLELFFLRLFRGTGNTGLAGMKLTAPQPSDPNIQLVRPLLNQPKEVLRLFALERQIPFSEDATNASLDYQRNRIRNELIPLLEQHYQPALPKTVPRLMELSGADADYITQVATDWLSRKNPPFPQLHLALQRRSLQLQLQNLGFNADFDQIEWLRLHPDRTITLDSGKSALRDPEGRVHLAPDDSQPDSPPSGEQSLTLATRGNADFGGLAVSWSISEEKGDQFASSENCEYFDADQVGRQILLRFWRTGDRFQPIGATAASKLQDLFTNLKVPRSQRHQRVVAIAENGEIFWVEGLRISARFKLDKLTVRRLKWQWRR